MLAETQALVDEVVKRRVFGLECKLVVRVTARSMAASCATALIAESAERASLWKRHACSADGGVVGVAGCNGDHIAALWL